MDKIKRYDRRQPRRAGRIFWKTMLITLACVALVAAGYFVAMSVDTLMRLL